MIAVVSPSRTSTSGRGMFGIKPWMKALYVSLMSRCDSAAIVPKTRLDFPEPETPVKTVRRRFGISMSMFLRLFSRAPRTRMTSWLSAMCRVGDDVSGLGVGGIVPPISRRSRHRLRRCCVARTGSQVWSWELARQRGRGDAAPCVPIPRERRRVQLSTHRLLHQLADPLLVGGSQLLQCVGGRPHGAVIKVRRVVEAKGGVPRLELARALEEADDAAVL